MGNSSSTSITTDLLVRRVKDIRSSLSSRDRRLFNYAKFTLANEKERLNNCELFIDFEDTEGITIQTNDVPASSLFVGYDEYDRPNYVWQRRGFMRRAKYFFVDNFFSLLNAAKFVVKGAITVASGIPAIMW